MLVVQAIESVDQRRRQRDRGRMLLAGVASRDRPGMEEIARAYEQATGQRTGCDWPTVFGRCELNLCGWSADDADTRSVESGGMEERVAWQQAAVWLREVERRAAKAEDHGALAVAAADAGRWREAVKHARRAWALEFHTGRPLRHHPPTWQRLYEEVHAAAEPAAPPE